MMEQCRDVPLFSSNQVWTPKVKEYYSVKLASPVELCYL